MPGARQGSDQKGSGAQRLNKPLIPQGTVGEGRDTESKSSHQAEAEPGGPIAQEMGP